MKNQRKLSLAYFSGKMLAKMGRIALIAEEMGRPEDARMVAARLAEASQVQRVWEGTAVPQFPPKLCIVVFCFFGSDPFPENFGTIYFV